MSSSNFQQEQKTVHDFVDLIERMALSEYRGLPQDLVSYQEIVEIGAIAVHILLTSNPKQDYNYSYLATAIRWAIRHELNHRYEWYTLERKSYNNSGFNEKHVIREVIYEIILSFDETLSLPSEDEVSATVEPIEAEELRELARNIRGSINKLPNQLRQVIEARFYRNLKNSQIEKSLYVSPLRILRTIQSGLDHVRLELNSDLNEEDKE